MRKFDLRDPRGDSKISRSPSMGRRWNHIGICDDDLGVFGTGAELAWSPGADSGPRASGKTHGAKVVTQDNVCNPT